jgi:hypothetical protein
MAVLVADGFDFYSTSADVTSRYPTASNIGFVSGAGTAFGSGQAAYYTSNPDFQWHFPWVTNEPTLFGSIRLKWNGNPNAATYMSLVFTDGTNNQCAIRWNGDGSIGLYTGFDNGTLIQTVASAYSLNAWNSFQFKVVISSTAGIIEIRKNGATTPIISLTGINTRGGSTNNYANGAMIHYNSSSFSVAPMQIDDLFINSASGAAPTSWPGDMRAMQQMPNGATQTQFSAYGPGTIAVDTSTGSNNGLGANNVLFLPFTASYGFSVSSATMLLVSSVTGHVKAAIYDSTGSGGNPGAVVSTSAEITDPAAGALTFNFTTTPSLTAGSVYFLAILSDTSVTMTGGGVGLSNSWVASATYTSGFPSDPASFTIQSHHFNWSLTVTPNTNAGAVSQATEDGDTTYVYSNTVGQEDIYTMSQIPASYTVVGVNMLVAWRMADVGTRTAQVSMQANGSADTAYITNGAIGYSYRFDSSFLYQDPTGAAWTPTTVNGAKIGLKITT